MCAARIKKLYDNFLRTKNRLERNDKPDYYLERLPPLLSRFLGYRKEPWTEPPKWQHTLSVLLSTFVGMMCHEAMFIYGPVLKNWHAPHVLPSFAAVAILLFNATTVPLAQPRNFFLGTMISSVIGVGICKLFMVHHNQEDHLWIGGALAVAVSSAVMDITNTVHPPAGAAALLPCLDDQVRFLGWKYLAAVAFTIMLFSGVAMLCDNIVTRWPAYWWKPKPKNLIASDEDVADPKTVFKIEIFADKINFPPGLELNEYELTYMESLQNKLLQEKVDQATLRSQRSRISYP